MSARIFPLARVAGLSRDQGLTTPEAAARRARHGANDVVEVARHPWWTLAGDTARDPMLWFLVTTSALYASIGETMEAATLAAAIVPLAAMDAYLHRRTSASTAGLRSRLAARARVVRDGGEMELAASEVVPGDLVIVAAGDFVPADGVVVACEEVQVDESTLTGESVPVRKRALPWPPTSGDEPTCGARALELRRNARARGAGTPARRVHRCRDAVRGDRAGGRDRQRGAYPAAGSRLPIWSAS